MVSRFLMKYHLITHSLYLRELLGLNSPKSQHIYAEATKMNLQDLLQNTYGFLLCK